jgi:hypothetical protein
VAHGCHFAAFALQLPLDDVVLSHLTQLDMFVESLKQQLADQSAAAKAAKAEAAAAAAAVAAGHVRGSDRRSRHLTPRSQYIQQQQQQQAAAQGLGAEGGEGQVSSHAVIRRHLSRLCACTLLVGWRAAPPRWVWGLGGL